MPEKTSVEFISVRIWINDSWFAFHDCIWSFHKPYFGRKHIFHKQIIQSEQNTRLWSLNLHISTKLFGNVIISKTFLSFISSTMHFFIEQKFCKGHFYRTENKQNAKTRQLTIQTFTAWFALVSEKHFVKLYTTRKFDFSCSMEMYHFKELP